MLNQKFYRRLQIALVASSLLSPQLSLAVTESQSRHEEVQRFANALYQIKKYYVSPVQDTTVFDNAIRGMLNGLDPHSTYLNEDDFAELEVATKGNFAGLGIEITLEKGALKVVTPIIDGPAYRAGIKSGDYIIKVDSQVVQGLSLEQAIKLFKGEAGTTANLVILRKGQEKPMVFSVKRENVAIKSVQSKLLEGQYGYIRLAQFQENTSNDMNIAIANLQKQANGHLKGLILDLRNNPGGLLNSAIDVADTFIDNKNNNDKKLIVYTEGRLPESKFTALASAGDRLNNAPMVVLINNGSASAAEIVAGALKDNKRAITLGTQSFGKGSVQTIFPLGNHKAIKLTTAFYYTPTGVSIQAKGITPDIVINDITIPKSTNSELTSFNEASLSGHIINKNNQNKEDQTNIENQSENLINKDFQLYSALNVLKGVCARSSNVEVDEKKS